MTFWGKTIFFGKAAFRTFLVWIAGPNGGSPVAGLGVVPIWGDKTLFEKNTGPHVAKRVGQFCDLVGVDSVDVISVIESVLVRVWSTKVP